jgi:hypothetical protein
VKRNKFNLIASGEIGKSDYFYQIGEINKHWTVRITKGHDMIRLFEYNEFITTSPPPSPPEGLIGWFYSQTKMNRINLNRGQLNETIAIVNSEALQKTFILRDKVKENNTKGAIFH